ncbi:hypothetical protein EUZ85_01330 [Hahella sp. KA22]|uniref:hypothetical protein n=1 Tax=Hahella sp. KA22 TaxID=1628392 RepID=UPI000FDDEB19|nr:hypothetical protein [Hahella sp. KA22]AZZ95136.1 hypothetical protein ENC22_29620 [Hahella sp. KA22]QAY52781.1 hypothetical protein EUZ85_01330 [Hahella sp. KA22]
MRTLLKTVHLLSIAVFFGSIAAYIFFGAVLPENDLHALTLNREWVAAGTAWLTLPAMWLAGLSGILLSGKPKATWLWIKVGGFVLIALNAQLMVYPAILLSLETVNGANQVFDHAMLREAVFGAFNVLLILALVVVAVKKPFRRSRPAA